MGPCFQTCLTLVYRFYVKNSIWWWWNLTSLCSSGSNQLWSWQASLRADKGMFNWVTGLSRAAGYCFPNLNKLGNEKWLITL